MRTQGAFAEARDRFTGQLEIGQALEDLTLIASAQSGLGIIALDLHDLATARHQIELSLALSIELGQQFGQAVDLHYLSEIAGRERDWPRAHLLAEQALAIMRQLRGPVGHRP